MTDDLYTASEICDLVGFSRSALAHHTRVGNVHPGRFGTNLTFTEEDLQNLILRHDETKRNRRALPRRKTGPPPS